jgi:carboxyl-terminal processing protease
MIKKMKLRICQSTLAMVMCFSSLQAMQKEKLHLQDIHGVMKQIFQQHVDKKEMTMQILKNSYRTFIDHFDPDRIYLLESEVLPYLQPTPQMMQQFLEQYQREDLSSYIQLNGLIQKSIERSRAYREHLQKDPSALFRMAQTIPYAPKKEQAENAPFPSTLAALKNRIEQELMQFIGEEIRHFGETRVMRDERKTLALYEQQRRSFENSYLGVDEKGAPLSAEEKENLFALHVLKALASGFDAHTQFFDDREAYDMKLRLEKHFDGIGIRVKQNNGVVIISSLIPGGAAAKSGQIQPHDQIVEINGHPIKQDSFNEVLKELREDSSSSIALLLKRTSTDPAHEKERLIHVSLTKESVTLNDDRVEVSEEKFGNGIIGKITLHMFYQGANGVSSAEDVKKAIETLKQKGNLRGLIIDLRDNGGGFLIQAVKVGGLFITSGVVVVSKYWNGNEQFYRDMDGKLSYDGPLVLLTSRWTASAAEILAQALQDYGVALIVGDEQTYGKGTIQSQTVTDSNNSSFFKVTVGKYYTVSGKTPQLQGVKADILVPSRFNQEPVGEEYLTDTVPADAIPNSYADDLSDVDPYTKDWYLQYYAPVLQRKQLLWEKMVPTLQKNSAYRISHNKAYKEWLQRPMQDSLRLEKKDFGKEDPQMIEATNIVKDMILLEPRMRDESVTP